MEFIYWILFFTLIYAYVGYGVLMFLLGFFVKPKQVFSHPRGYHVTLLVAAHNEENHIRNRIENALSQQVGDNRLDIVIVSDGSTDQTVAIAREYADRGVRVIETVGHNGKSAALNEVMPSIEGDLVVFSDANTIYRVDTIAKMLRHFEDAEIGGVCGKLQVPGKKTGWLSLAEDLYWNYDNRIKLAETRLGNTVSAQGSVYAIRRELFRPIPPGVADDFFQSAQIITQGKRLVFDAEAISEEYVTDNIGNEFNRRVRSTQQGWRGIMVLSELLDPFKYGVYSLQLFSHKVLRRLTPFLLLIFFVVNGLICDTGTWYLFTWWAQIVLYGLAVVAWRTPTMRRVPGIGIPLFFVSGHLAMGMGVIKAMRGGISNKWTPVRSYGTDEQ